jgi:hypothetical protein
VESNQKKLGDEWKQILGGRKPNEFRLCFAMQDPLFFFDSLWYLH